MKKTIVYKGKCDNCGMEVIVNEAQNHSTKDEEDLYPVAKHDVYCWGCGKLLHLQETDKRR